MGKIGRDMKNAKKYHGDKSTAWSDGAANKKGTCPGCDVRYDKMGANTFKKHAETDFKECPDT